MDELHTDANSSSSLLQGVLDRNAGGAPGSKGKGKGKGTKATANQLCYVCHKKGHLSYDCPHNKQVNGEGGGRGAGGKGVPKQKAKPMFLFNPGQIDKFSAKQKRDLHEASENVQAVDGGVLEHGRPLSRQQIQPKTNTKLFMLPKMLGDHSVCIKGETLCVKEAELEVAKLSSAPFAIIETSLSPANSHRVYRSRSRSPHHSRDTRSYRDHPHRSRSPYYSRDTSSHRDHSHRSRSPHRSRDTRSHRDHPHRSRSPHRSRDTRSHRDYSHRSRSPHHRKDNSLHREHPDRSRTPHHRKDNRSHREHPDRSRSPHRSRDTGHPRSKRSRVETWEDNASVGGNHRNYEDDSNEEEVSSFITATSKRSHRKVTIKHSSGDETIHEPAMLTELAPSTEQYPFDEEIFAAKSDVTLFAKEEDQTGVQATVTLAVSSDVEAVDECLPASLCAAAPRPPTPEFD